MTEEGILEAIAAILGSPPSPGGIGDDAAVLPHLAGLPIVTVDAAVESVHFTRALLSLEDVGYRATMAAASDLAAMGAVPRALLAAITAPPGTPREDFEALARGQRAAADMLRTQIVGGNLSRGSELTITTTVIGEAFSPLVRSGAQPGDLVGVFGWLGAAAAGLRLLLRRGASARAAGQLDYPDTYRCLEAFRRPRALIAEGMRLAGRASSAMDVSDGLAADAERLARASGVRLELSKDGIVAAAGLAVHRAALELDTTALELALTGGEDYALLFTAAALPAGATLLGRVVPGPPGLGVLDESGAMVPLPAGFAHFH